MIEIPALILLPALVVLFEALFAVCVILFSQFVVFEYFVGPVDFNKFLVGLRVALS